MLVLACAVSYAGEDKSPKPLVTDLPPATKEQALPEVDWSASKQSFDEARNAVILAGSAWVRYRGNKLEADNIVFFRESREMYAEGNIRLRAGESEMAAQAAYVDVNNDTGYLIDAVVRVSAPPTALKGLGGKEAKDEDPDRAENRSTLLNRSKDPYGVYLMPAEDPQARTNLVFKAQKIVKQGRMLYSAEDAFITSDDMVHPMYGVKAGSLDFYMYEVDDPQNPGKKELKPQKVVVKRARLNILGTSLFPFPTLKYDIEKRSSFFDAHFGNSDRWGPFMLTRFGYNLEGGENKIFDPTRVYLDLDERMERGPAAGFELDWQSGVRPVESGEKKFERGQGHLRVYAIDEIQTSRSDALRRARRDLERRIQPKIDGFPRQQYDANLLFTRRRRLEDAGPPSFDLDIRRDDFRGMIDFQQHQPLKRLAGVDNLLLDLKFQRESDRDFLHEYFYRDYLNQNQPEALASLRKPGDNYSVELLYRGSTQDFDAGAPRSPTNFGTFTNYQPALTYSLVSTPLPGGFYLRSELQGARLKREFERSIYDQESFDANRAYAIVDFSRPIKWGPLNFVPHIGTQQQIYDNSRQGETTSQGALTYGFDLSSRIYGTFPEFENEALGLQGGLRHIIEPRISYNVVGDTRESAEDLLDFDQIDDLTPVDRMTFAVEQTFQTKRATKEGGTRTVNFAGFDVAMDFLPRNRDQERLLGGDALDLVRVDGFLRVLDVVKVAGHLGVRPQDLRTERAAYSITIDPGTRWRLKLEERFHFADSARSIVGSDQIHVKFEYQLSERWAVAFERVSEARKSLQTRKGRQVERVSVTRSYGPLDATLTYSVDRNLGEKSVFASVRPTATYRNLIVPSQDLLVASGELTGEEDTPEERNFDPFDLLRQRKQKRNKSDGKFTNPPGPIRDQDVPTPPTPGSDARGDGARKSDNTALFRDPNEPVNASTRQSAIFKDPNERPAKPARKVDEDDWTAPTTPASTRK
ncbi:MAG TPA: LPS assembly protein LptD [Planctomycetota bacterium]|nr:LPS assembly protein LptD [Planctomycetota bacterium]